MGIVPNASLVSPFVLVNENATAPVLIAAFSRIMAQARFCASLNVIPPAFSTCAKVNTRLRVVAVIFIM